jgi:hypothetical protein
MSNERRRHERVPALLEVIWESAAGEYEARLSDLSLGGCFLDTIGEARVREVITFKVRLPAGHWLRLRGQVTHYQRGIGIGVCFPEMSEGYSKLLAQVIDELKRCSGK